MEYGFELCLPESKVYAARVNNMCVAHLVLCNFGAHFNESLMKRFRESCFGHLLGLHKTAFSGQIVHALALRRVGGLGVKDMMGLSYAIEPDITSGGDAHNRFMKAHFSNRGHITCSDLENAFLKSERGSEDLFKLGLLYFVEFVIMGKPQNVKINEELQDSLLFAPGKKESDEEKNGKVKGQEKGKKAVWSSVRKGKKKVEDEKPKRINRPAWNIKGLSYAIQIWVYELIAELGILPLRYCKRIEEPALVPRNCRWESTDKVPEFKKLNVYIFQSKQLVILHLLRPSQLEMSQPYWSWGSDVLEFDAPSVGLRVCKDLDELNSVVQQLRNEVAVLYREKGQLEERVLCSEKCTRYADARKTRDARAERNKTKDAGEERNKTEDAGAERNKTKDAGEERNEIEDAGEESQKTEDAGEESDKTDDGGVAESREQCVQNAQEEVQYTPPDINWDNPGVLGSGEKSEILGPAMKRRRAVVRETPWTGQEIPNISEDTIADPLRPVPHDSLLELCGEDGMEGSHNFFVRLLTKDGWLDDSNIDMALLLVRERHERSGNWVGSDWTILDTTFQKCAALDYKEMKTTQAIQRAVQPVAKILPWLLKESGYIGDGLIRNSEWPVIRVMDAPQQGDCGMYILKYCEFLTSNVDLAKISHDAMPLYRLKLAV
ncbi:unnamed protein product [Prunus armeniaca]